jgi:hypothetical protein
VSVPDAIGSDPHLLEEARAHLLNQYGLLRRLKPVSAPGEKVPRLRAARKPGIPKLRDVQEEGDY